MARLSRGIVGTRQKVSKGGKGPGRPPRAFSAQRRSLCSGLFFAATAIGSGYVPFALQHPIWEQINAGLGSIISTPTLKVTLKAQGRFGFRGQVKDDKSMAVCLQKARSAGGEIGGLVINDLD